MNQTCDQGSKSERKREQIYDGVFRLYLEGTEPELLRMEAVSRACRIPKGTIYEYFSGKEELIQQAFAWKIASEVDAMNERIGGAKTFEEKWELLIGWLRSPVGQKILMLRIGGKDPQHSEKMTCGTGPIMRQLIEAGRRDGVLGNGGGALAEKTVLFSMISPLLYYERNQEEFTELSLDEILNYMKKIFIAAFA